MILQAIAAESGIDVENVHMPRLSSACADVGSHKRPGERVSRYNENYVRSLRCSQQAERSSIEFFGVEYGRLSCHLLGSLQAEYHPVNQILIRLVHVLATGKREMSLDAEMSGRDARLSARFEESKA